jgi:hypothetical protein
MTLVKEVLNGANLTAWPITTMIIFMTFTAVMLWWIFRKGSSEIYHDLKHSVLDEQPQDTQQQVKL